MTYKKPHQTSLLEELPASRSQYRDLGKDLEKIEETSHLSLYALLKDYARHGFFGKTSLGSCPRKEDGTLEPSSEGWRNSGMGSPTGFLTLNTSELNDFQGQSPKDEGVCSLWDILETGEIPPRFFLTEKHCQGIINRAENKGKALPKALRTALLEAINTFKTK